MTMNAPSWIRTSGLLLRRESLYPAELSGPGAILIPNQQESRRVEAMLAAEIRARGSAGNINVTCELPGMRVRDVTDR